VLDTARAAYEKSLIRAPFDGIVTEVNLDAGQLSQITAIMPKAPIRVVDIAPRYVEAELDEVDLPAVKRGMRARVKILAVGRDPFYGTVRKVVPFVSTLREQDRTSLIELELPPGADLLPVGASADIEIIVSERNNVLALPPRTVFGRGSERYVFRAVQGNAVKTDIKTGLSNYERVEILSGLERGEVVIFPPEREDIRDGLPIKVEVVRWP
jgi:HlyD family secretion protein